MFELHFVVFIKKTHKARTYVQNRQSNKIEPNYYGWVHRVGKEWNLLKNLVEFEVNEKSVWPS